jgi:DNA-binding MarR family transcriptional regulator
MDTHALTRQLETFASLDPEMQIPAMLAFLYIAHLGRCSQKDLEVALGFSNAAASRNVSYWTHRRFDRRPGHDMVERHEDPFDRRLKALALNNRGKMFFAKLRGTHG